MASFLPDSMLQASPTLAMYMAQQTQQSDLDTAAKKRQELAAIIQDMQQKTQQSAQMNPLLLQHQDLQNQGLSASLPGLAGTAQSLAAKGQVDQATIPAQIASTNASSDLEQTKAAGAKSQRLFSTILQVAPAVSQADATSPGAGMVVLKNAMKVAGYAPGSTEDQFVNDLFRSAPAGQLGTAMKQVAEAMIKLTPDYKTKMDEANVKGGYGVQEANIRAGGEMGAASIRAKAEERMAQAKLSLFTNDEATLNKIHDPAARQSFMSDKYSQAVSRQDNDSANLWYSRMQANLPLVQASLNAKTQGGVSAPALINDGKFVPATTNLTMPPPPPGYNGTAAPVAPTAPALKGAGEAQVKAPNAGDVQQGYRFKGGKPSDPANWEKVN